jgi:hypothetical protein
MLRLWPDRDIDHGLHRLDGRQFAQLLNCVAGSPASVSVSSEAFARMPCAANVKSRTLRQLGQMPVGAMTYL